MLRLKPPNNQRAVHILACCKDDRQICLLMRILHPYEDLAYQAHTRNGRNLQHVKATYQVLPTETPDKENQDGHTATHAAQLQACHAVQCLTSSTVMLPSRASERVCVHDPWMVALLREI